MPDRSGAREPKGASLKQSKKNPGAPTGRTKKQPKAEGEGPTLSAPPPRPGLEPYFDCAAALLSRQFDRDRDRVLQRAKSDGVCSIVCWFSDVEKLDALLDLCKSYNGQCYLLAGIHPDNIERTNKKSHDGWLAKVEEIGRHPFSLGILSGLNLGREIGTHFAQESLLRSSCAVANRLMLPLVLHIAPNGTSLERAIEILREEGWISTTSENNNSINTEVPEKRVILHDVVTACGTDPLRVKLAVDANLYCIVSAAGITDPDTTIRTRAVSCVTIIPHHRLLTGSDSPWRTPQNIPDPYLRTLRNEPSNMVSVVQAITQAVGLEAPNKEFEALLRQNAIAVYGLESLPPAPNHSHSSSSHHVAHPPHPGTSSSSSSKHPVSQLVESTASLTLESSSHEKISTEGTSENSTDLTTSNIECSVNTTAMDGTGGSDTNSEQQQPLPPMRSNVDESSSSSPSMTLSSHHITDTQNTVVSKEGNVSTNDTSAGIVAAGYFGCIRCRNTLFFESMITIHSLDATKTVFKVGEEGLCQAAVFVPCSSETDLGQRTGLSVSGGSVECAQCEAKLGKYTSGESSCPCGALVQGPTARIITSKVDYFDETQDASTLHARARIEAEGAQDLLDLEEVEFDHLKSKKMKKKKTKAIHNKGNFSEFRNKTFIPNASRVAKSDKQLRENNGRPADSHDSEEEQEDGGDGEGGVDEEEEEEEQEEVVEKDGRKRQG